MSDDAKREIHLSEEEAWRIYRLLEEMNAFLHQPMHYPTIEDVHRWLDEGIFRELSELLYRVVGPWFPVDEETGYVVGPGGKLYDGGAEVAAPSSESDR